MKRFLSSLLCLCILLSLAACGQSEKNEPSQSGASGGEEKQTKGKIVYMYWEDVQGSNDFLGEDWNSKNPDVTVEMQSVGWNNYHDTLITAAASGSMPDVFKIEPSWIPELINLKAVLPLDDYVDKWDSKDSIPQSMWEAARADQDMLYTCPNSLVALYLYCRKSYFQQAGVEYPETMEEFYNACEKLTMDTNNDGATDVYGFSLRGARGGHYMWAGLTMNSGVKFFNDDGSVALNSPEMVEANKKYLDIYRNGWAPKTAPTDGNNECAQNFKSGVTSMLVHHVNSYQDITNALGDDVEIVPLPTGEVGRWVPIQTATVSVFSESKFKDASVEFLEFMLLPEEHSQYCEKVGQVPFVEEVTKEDKFTSNKSQLVSMANLDAAKTFPVVPTFGDWSEKLWPQTMQRALLGEIESKEMMQILADGLSVK